MELGNLKVDLVEVFFMFVGKSGCPSAESRNMGEKMYQLDNHAVLVSTTEEVDASGDEDGHKGKEYARRNIKWHKTEACHDDIGDYCHCPETEMGKDEHHGKEEDGGCGTLCADIGFEFEDLVWFASGKSHGCDVVEGKGCDGPLEQSPVGHSFGRSASTKYDEPRQGIHHIKSEPQQDDGHKPIARRGDVLPEVCEGDFEGEAHHYDGDQSYKEEYVAVEGFDGGGGIVSPTAEPWGTGPEADG